MLMIAQHRTSKNIAKIVSDDYNSDEGLIDHHSTSLIFIGRLQVVQEHAQQGMINIFT
jgi:hypothetical protein